MNNLVKAIIAISLLVGFFTGVALGHFLGIKNGIDKYHKMCYDIGGIVVDRSNKTIVVCQKAGVIQEHELDRLDKD